ncbi:threonine aldolase family protein [Agathobacter ruminis]|uniref:Low specificity L-threonine aldolase n=1 Tax=Agathobacter ruminis TaxID=1712665 RepID=A0A2G3E6N5_9FIRM|nr:aminotransferase class I/II-fold pyridoxal phosphate-dependent enzyme [Agathobacter ruminis]MDC7301735.1 aminotransferase class I/II-fold pyridoxal phosphate-dependent enzyme [Agathobacter ruminis]PHU38861.1 low specificity L-threonine aldolase [Agathobacter ruminis]
MLNFASDYIAGAHPAILKKLEETNMELLPGYGTDHYTAQAKEKIKNACHCQDADVYFLVGGTQTNSTIIGAMLADYEGVVSADTGHINAHEAGAVEYTGHKVLTIPGHDGKIDAKELKDYIAGFYGDDNYTHMVFPGMVYISYPTEYGTIYSKDEMEQIHAICKQYDIPLFVDGARLGYGLASKESDLTLETLAANCDVFYIGGTKVGALFGEAVVFTHANAPKHFYTMTKQHGAMLAKGWLTGLQYDVLFTDDLYMQVSRHAIEMAEKLKEILKKHGMNFYLESPTNQQFVIIEDEKARQLEKHVVTSFWEKYDETHTVIRFATAWSTTEENLEALNQVLAQL